MHMKLTVIVKISHDHPDHQSVINIAVVTITSNMFSMLYLVIMMMIITWNMFSMSYFISLKVGRLPASHCQHSLIRLYTPVRIIRMK